MKNIFNLKNISKVLFSLLFISIFTLNTPATTYAADCSAIDPYKDDLQLVSIICPVARVINLMLASAGTVFAAMVAVASYQYATSQGDPKGALGAKNTLTYAVMGLFGVVGVFVILNLISSTFGFNNNVVGVGVFGEIEDRITDFMNIYVVK